jgi:hypothetical protein
VITCRFNDNYDEQKTSGGAKRRHQKIHGLRPPQVSKVPACTSKLNGPFGATSYTQNSEKLSQNLMESRMQGNLHVRFGGS